MAPFTGSAAAFLASPSSSPYSAPYGASASGSSSSGTPASDPLSSQDILWLSAPLQAAFSVQTPSVTGMLCNQSGAGSACSRSTATLSTSRWDISNGLETAATFAISGAGTSVTLNVGFSIQDVNLTAKSFSLSLHPSHVQVSNQVKSGVNYREYQLHFEDVTLSNGEAITQLQATLVYQVHGQTAVLSTPDSGFSFGRKNVTTVVTAWDPTSPTRAPAQDSTPYVIADEVQFSMSLQKSP